ncbi:TPA: hypothetical protein DIS56_00705 [Candidatus Saccharibacteria bacterium]|nr:MAG: hypothetical protein A3F05_02980 [Candidatus Saccharibacteria bacterium RIFCSPHIGHO2_12_FULL_47_17]HCM51643.1 hypothetical protein [Candidatus Saccharibacteria bacterium]
MERRADGSTVLISLAEETTAVSALHCTAQCRLFGRRGNLQLASKILELRQANSISPLELSSRESRKVKKAIKFTVAHPSTVRDSIQEWADSKPSQIGHVSLHHTWGQPMPSLVLHDTQEVAQRYTQDVLSEAQRMHEQLRQAV